MTNTVKIRVPATSANIGPGFDTFGIALSFYNEYLFEESDSFEMKGFEEQYLVNNLVKESYIKAFNHIGKEVIPAKITIKQDVPICGGLGSSANCIIAGVLGAYRLSKTNYEIGDIVQLCAEYEGHPDNVVPAFFGELTSSIDDDEDFAVFTYKINPELQFALLIPHYCLNTKKMRDLLPETVNYKDAVFNISRVANIPHAFEKGDFEHLKVLLKDKLHEDYRLSLIKNGKAIKKECESKGYIC
ncbi:MAG: homoserine kinase, partial [Bacilli bacterium]